MNKFNTFFVAICVTFFLIVAGCSQPGGTENPAPPGPTALPTAPPPQGPAAVNLGTAAYFAILAESGITTDTSVPLSLIVGNIGVSPITYASITGFSLNPAVPAVDTTYATSPRVIGSVYAADYTGAGGITPTMLTAAVTAKTNAYTDAAGRAPIAANTNLGTAGDIGGLVFAPGVYTWNTPVTVSSNIILSGGPDDTWIFQISGTFSLGTNISTNLLGGAQAKNIVWAVADVVALGANSHLSGIILTVQPKPITLLNGATVNGRLLSGGAVTLISNAITQP